MTQTDSLSELQCPSSGMQKVLQFSPGRTGSTVVYQILRMLGYDVTKTHDATNTNLPIVTTYRDPRDVFCSYYRISKNLKGNKELKDDLKYLGFPGQFRYKWAAIRYVKRNFYELALQLKKSSNICLLKYEEFVYDHDYIYQELEKFFGVQIDGSVRDRIKSATSVDVNQKRSKRYSQFGEYDTETLIHGKHVGSAEVGQWKIVCPSWLQLSLNLLLWREIIYYRKLATGKWPKHKR